jgi:hypothetical protein
MPLTVRDSTGGSTVAVWYSSTSTDSISPVYRSLVTLSNTTTVREGTAFAEVITVAWQYSDLAKFPGAYAESLAKRIGVDFTATVASSTPTASRGAAASPATSSSLPRDTNVPASPPSKGLSTGAKAGIGVGAALAFFILTLVFAILYIRKKRQQRAVTTTEPAAPAETPEMADQDADLATRKWYLGGRWRNEAEAKNDPGELDSRAVRVVPGPPVELDAVERRRV